MKVDEFKLKEAIIDKYGNQATFAKKLGLSEPQISRGIKSQSPKFISLCKKAGIDIDSLLDEEELSKSSTAALKLKVAEKRIKELENLVENQNHLIASYEAILKSKLKETN